MVDIRPHDAAHLADEILEEFDDICRELDILYCLVYGTCLGFYRDNDYVPSDGDIDIKAIYINHDSSPLQQALIAHGFTPFPVPPYEDKHYRKHNILLEVAELLQDGSVYIIKPSAPRADDFRFTSFDYVVHGDRVYRIPHPVGTYLAWQYGEDWQIPKAGEEHRIWSEARGEKTKIVYTSGNWDLFHYGHLKFLGAASRAGTKLIVGVSTDESIERIRGQKPIIPYEQRRAIVAGLRFVDEVVPFESYEQTVEWMKARGITTRAINEPSAQAGFKAHPECREEGGVECIVIPRTPSVSTTMIRERILICQREQNASS